MDTDSHSDERASRWQFGLRALFVVFTVSALMLSLTLSLFEVGGGEILASTLVVGLVIGGAISLLGSNKAGITPLVIICASLAGALILAILGVYDTGFNVEDKMPQGYRTRGVFWCGFFGALLGAAAGAVGRWLTNRSTGAADERECGE